MADAVRFLLGHEARELRAVDPNLTVLNWLREVERRTGTKEGCAEGDCGACTVVLGEVADGTIRYRAVNACILFVPQLDGRQLITVEDLRAPDGSLHPVQQAMVECHGSQCGFCTPGFVMSLFALYHEDRAPSRQRILDVLAGNLCRCTGYRPIIDAARRMHEQGEGDQFSAREPETTARLRAFAGDDRLAFARGGKRYFAPRRIEDLSKHHCVLFPAIAPKGVWTFRRGGRKHRVQVGGAFETDEMDAVRAAVVAGLGISPLPAYMVADDLREGRLVPVLRKFQIAPESAIYLVYLPNRTLPSRVRALIDFLAERFGPVPPSEAGW